MDNEAFITKKYNHMNFDNMDSWFNVSFSFNSFNCLLGLITMQDFQIISGLLGLLMQLILFLTKQFYMIRNNKDPDEHSEGNGDVLHSIESQPFSRRCAGCGQPFTPAHPDMIFCESDCKERYMTNLQDRKPLLKKNKKSDDE